MEVEHRALGVVGADRHLAAVQFHEPVDEEQAQPLAVFDLRVFAVAEDLGVALRVDPGTVVGDRQHGPVGVFRRRQRHARLVFVVVLDGVLDDGVQRAREHLVGEHGRRVGDVVDDADVVRLDVPDGVLDGRREVDGTERPVLAREHAAEATGRPRVVEHVVDAVGGGVERVEQAGHLRRVDAVDNLVGDALDVSEHDVRVVAEVVAQHPVEDPQRLLVAAVAGHVGEHPDVAADLAAGGERRERPAAVHHPAVRATRLELPGPLLAPPERRLDLGVHRVVGDESPRRRPDQRPPRGARELPGRLVDVGDHEVGVRDDGRVVRLAERLAIDVRFDK
nr:hypothetical protein [Halobaculum sp. DT92]